MEKTNRKRSRKKKDILSVFLEALTEMGCQYEFADSRLICFFYKGKKYRAYYDSKDELNWDTIPIFYFYFTFSNSQDSSWVTRVIFRVNGISNSICTNYGLIENTDGGYLVSKTSINCISQIRDLKIYLNKILNDFAIVQTAVEDEMKKCEQERLLNMTGYFAQNDENTIQN